MRSKNSILQFRLYLIGAVILIAGLAGAIAVYLKVNEGQSDTIGYEFVNGKAYAITASDSKMYRHELERFGGKAAVFADDFNRWFAGLWRGKRLAYILAVLAIGTALVFFLLAYRLSGHDSSKRTETQDG